jgi:2',3'-cyclic-nucleotide 2'-phosphodiesterase (5'-nucleotidase family)
VRLARPFFALAIVLLCASAAASAETLTILHINDLHGALQPARTVADGTDEGGIARLATLVRAERTPATLFLAGGDLMQGTNLSNLFSGKPVIEALNLMGLDASAVGNHEFDNGLAAFRERAKEAAFPFLASNIDGDGPWKPGIVRTVGRLRVALFGLATPDTPVETHPLNVRGLAFRDAVAAARAAVAELRPRADLVVVLSHLGSDEDERLAAAVPGIDVIVGGHTHTKITQPVIVGSTLILQAYERGTVLGRLALTVEGGRVIAVDYRLLPITPELAEDPQVAAVVERYRRRLDAKMAEVVGTALVDLEGTKESLRTRETNLGDVVADAMREAAGAEVALVNGGTIRAGIPAGPVTVGTLYNALPFDNWVISFAVTGAELRQALEIGLSRVETRDGGFPHVSGMTYTFNPSAPAGHRVVAVTVGGAPLDEHRRYVLATHDFLAAGGNGFTVFSGHEPVFSDSGRWLRDLLAQWWRRRGEVRAAVDGRIAEAR